MNDFSPWEQMIAELASMLDGGTRVPEQGRGNVIGAREPNETGVRANGIDEVARAIVAVERLNGSTVLVSWSDSTRCRYDEQRWVNAKSRRKGRCALSGELVQVGDDVYKPQWRGSKRPGNSAEMILASAMDCVIRGCSSRLLLDCAQLPIEVRGIEVVSPNRDSIIDDGECAHHRKPDFSA